MKNIGEINFNSETRDKTIVDVMFETVKNLNLNINDFSKLKSQLITKISNKSLQD